MRLDLPFFHEHPSGQLISRVISGDSALSLVLACAMLLVVLFAAMAGARIIGSSLTGRPAGVGTAANVLAAIDSTLADNDSAQLAIAATTDGDESGPLNGQFTVTLSQAASTGVRCEMLLRSC